MAKLRDIVFITHPTISFTSLSFLFCCLAISPRPAFVPLALLLTVMQLYARIVICRPGLSTRSCVLWLSLTTAVVLSHIAPALTALSNPSTSIAFLIISAGTTSAIALGTIFMDARISMVFAKTPWAQITLFPTLWALVWALVSHTSAVGRLATWSAVRGIPTDVWVVRQFGVGAIDWMTAAWSVVFKEAIGDWFIGSAPAQISSGVEDGDLVDIPVHPKDRSRTSPVPRSYYVLGLFGVLLALTVQPYISSSIPISPYSDNATPLKVACILPPRHKWKNGPPSLDDFIKESNSISAAKIKLWPEGAVRFDTLDAKAAAIEQVRAKAAFSGSSYIGVSFDEVYSADGKNRSDTIKRRNGFVLVNRDGPVLEYYKRHLVPVAESFSLSPSSDPPTIYTLPLVKPSDFSKGEWGNATRPIPLTASICLDFTDQDAFRTLPSKPALILAPARTWHISVGLSMFEQAKARAAELDSMVLWCDGGEGGVSGIVGRGINEIMQVGQGSWVRTIGIQYPFDDKKTFFMEGGEAIGLIAMWALCGVPWAATLATTGIDNWRAWRASRRANEEEPLLG